MEYPENAKKSIKNLDFTLYVSFVQIYRLWCS